MFPNKRHSGAKFGVSDFDDFFKQISEENPFQKNV
jgi:hypothetical protein